MKDYGIKDYVLEATTAVREARNLNVLLDQVLVKTGFVMDVINLPRKSFERLRPSATIWNPIRKRWNIKADTFLWIYRAEPWALPMCAGERWNISRTCMWGLIRMKEYFTRNEQGPASILGRPCGGAHSGQSFSCHAGTGKISPSREEHVHQRR